MTLRRALPFVGLAIAASVVRRDLLVRAIRALDRRGGLANRRGERAYAGVAGLFSGLHRRAALDAAAAVGDRPASVVDIGSGPGDLLAQLGILVPAAMLTGIEPSPEMRAIASARGISTVEGRAEGLPLPDRSIDLVVSTLSMHHWNDPARALAEIWRVLRPGGQARIYDVRFAAYSQTEVEGFARAASMPARAVDRYVLEERLFGFRPYVVITVSA
jgi:ubiquinone/menaquinone biosynthesis C-methylase UbiE